MLWQHGAADLARRIATGEASSLQVVEAHLARIDAVNPRVNAVVRVLADEARAGAALADQAVARGDALGPLHGVPFTVKENIDLKGHPTTWGVHALANALVPLDAPVVERMRAAGAIPIARTNLPDMGLRMTTESSLHGITRNPWNLERTAAGSSGGEAAALATGMSPIGLGNDLGGSLRSPASACGIVAIRPSAGRVPHAGLVPAEDRLLTVQLMLVQGPMARTVADVRLGLRVLMGAHPRDPWSISAPLEGPPSKRPVRVAVVAEPPGGSCDPVVAASVRRAADSLANAGYEVVEACPPRFEEAVSVWARLLAADFGTVIERMAPLMGEVGRAGLQAFIADSAGPATLAELSKLLVIRDGIARNWSQFMARHPLLLTPAWTQLPFAHGFDVASAQGGAQVVTMSRALLPANLLGLPSVSVPGGRDVASGLPIGVLLTGQRFREDLCLDAAEVVEAQRGFATPMTPQA